MHNYMTDKISFKISNFVERISTPPTDLAGKKGGPVAPAKLKVGNSGSEAATGTAGQASRPQAADTALGKQTAASRQIMESFLQPSTPNKRKPEDEDLEDNLSKRPAQGTSDGGIEEDATWREKLRSAITEVGLSEDQTDRVMTIVMDAFNARVAQEAKRAAIAQVNEDYENKKNLQSVIIHRADQWVDDNPGMLNLTLAERVTVAVHALTGGSVTVLDAFA